jgi:anti-anti-sigma factor
MGRENAESTFEVALERVDGQCVVVVRGDLDMNAEDALWARIEEVRTSGQPLVLDLSETTFMDSTGIKLLLRAYMAQGQLREAVTLRAPSAAVTHTMAVAGIDGIMRIENATHLQSHADDVTA